MKAKTLILIFLLLGLNNYTFAQKEYKGKINLVNEKGKKEGLWIEKQGNHFQAEIYYKNGIESGIFKRYNGFGKLDTFGEYKDGEMIGTWFDFGDDGHLTFTLEKFAKNTDSVLVDRRRFMPEYKCYTKSYHPNGEIENEGTLLFFKDDGPYLDTTIEFGEWKYYDESGKLIKTQIFK